jgi:predicted MFS family arabinose efflux permease
MYSDSPEERTSYRKNWIMVGWILFVQTICPMGYYGLSALAPFILEDWGINRQQFGMMVSAFSTGTFLLAFPAGILTDRIGVRTILITGQACVGTFITLAPWLPRYFQVLVVMFLAGTGYGLFNPPASKAVYGWAPPKQRALALSSKQSSLPLCGALSGLLLPPLSLLLGWRETWMTTGLITLAGAVFAVLVYRDPPASDSSITTSPAFFSSAFRLLRNGVMLRLIFCGFLLTGIQISWHNYIVIYLKEHLSTTTILAGTYLALKESSAIFGRPILGLFSDTVFNGSRRGVLVLVGIANFLLGLWLAVLPTSTPLWTVAFIFVLFGFTGISWHGVHLTWMTEMAGRTSAGTASGLWICGAHLGFIFLGPIFGAIVDATGTYTQGWLFTCLLAGLATLTLLSVRSKNP